MWHIAVQQKERKQLFLLNYFTPGIPKEPFCWSHLVGEWLHEVKPITLKNHGRPAQSLFRYGFDYLRACLFHHHESARQYAFHQALEQLFKRLGWSPQKSRSSPTVDSIPLTI